MMNKKNIRVSISWLICSAAIALIILVGFQSARALPDLRGNWEGTLTTTGAASATPIPIVMSITSVGIGQIGGTFSVSVLPSGTLSGSVTDSVFRFTGDAADVDLSNGRATFTDYGGGAAILDGLVTVAATNAFLSGPRRVREIRAFQNMGGCPCAPPAGDYNGTWGDNAEAIKFTVQSASPSTPTKFTSYLYITINGQLHGYGLYGTANADRDVVAIAHGNDARIKLTGQITNWFFYKKLAGTFELKFNDGTTLTMPFSANKY